VTISRWFADVFPKPAARKSRRRFPVAALVELLENRVLLSAQTVIADVLTTLPGTAADDVALELDLVRGGGNLQEVGLFVFDADGTVDGLNPGDEGFDEAVLDRRMIVFDAAGNRVASDPMQFIGGTELGFYLCSNSDSSSAQFETQMTSSNGIRLAFEETTPIWPSVSGSLGGRSLDDAVIDVTIGDPVALPVIEALEDRVIPEEQLLQFTVAAENPAGPSSDLRFELGTAPPGATIDELTGEFSWTPTESQGPGRFDVVVIVFNQSRPEASSNQRFVIDVTEVNSAPVISPIGSQTVNQSQQLRVDVQVSDADRPIVPVNRFTFSLVNNTVSGATINVRTGVFTWTPSLNDAPGLYEFEVQVLDNGTPQQGDTETFTVEVLPPANP